MVDKALVTKSGGGRYTRKGKKDDFVDGKLSEDGKKYSLDFLMGNCVDFLEEKTDLEHLAESLCDGCDHDCSIVFTPKFHCEIAGEGIEYSWGASKRWYRKQSFAAKRSFDNFEILVMNSLKRVNINMCRRFSRKARRYMVGYLHQMLENNTLDVDDGVVAASGVFFSKSSHIKNEVLHKVYASHRDANTTDGAFIERVMRECINVDDEFDEKVI